MNPSRPSQQRADHPWILFSTKKYRKINFFFAYMHTFITKLPLGMNQRSVWNWLRVYANITNYRNLLHAAWHVKVVVGIPCTFLLYIFFSNSLNMNEEAICCQNEQSFFLLIHSLTWRSECIQCVYFMIRSCITTTQNVKRT